MRYRLGQTKSRDVVIIMRKHTERLTLRLAIDDARIGVDVSSVATARAERSSRRGRKVESSPPSQLALLFRCLRRAVPHDEAATKH